MVSLSDVKQAEGQRRAAVDTLRLPEDRVAAVVVTAMNRIDDAAQRARGETRVLPLELISRRSAIASREDHPGVLEGMVAGRIRQTCRGAAQGRRRAPATGLVAPRRALERGPVHDGTEFFREWLA